MASRNMVHWNYGLAAVLFLVIFGYLAKLKMDFNAGKVKKDDGTNLVTMLSNFIPLC
jgi:hypothetical protein